MQGRPAARRLLLNIGEPFSNGPLLDCAPMAQLRHLSWSACALLTLVGVSLLAQDGGAPRNDLPQPYRTSRDWGELPRGMPWPAVTAVEPAPDGSIYVIERCFQNSCAGRQEP